MDNMSQGTFMSAAGALSEADVDSEDCKVYRDAIKIWCDPANKKKGGKRRSFNDLFYQLRGGAGAREFPMGIQLPGGEMENFVDLAAQAGEQMGALSGLAQALSNIFQTYVGLAAEVAAGTMGWDGVRNIMKDVVPQEIPGAKTNFPDDTTPEGSRELKGPGDKQRPNQFEKERRSAPNQSLLVVGQKCDTEGRLTKGGRCKSPQPP